MDARRGMVGMMYGVRLVDAMPDMFTDESASSYTSVSGTRAPYVWSTLSKITTTSYTIVGVPTGCGTCGAGNTRMFTPVPTTTMLNLWYRRP